MISSVDNVNFTDSLSIDKVTLVSLFKSLKAIANINTANSSMSTKPRPGHFRILYFASASSFTGQTSDDLPAPLPVTDLFDVLEKKYPGFHKQVLCCCAVTINLNYVDLDEYKDGDSSRVHAQESFIREADEVAIIPPVSSG